jgi:phage tail-like protein
MNSAGNNFRYVNQDGYWPDFRWEGLELRPDGALQLSSVPLLSGELPPGLAGLQMPDGPAGIAVAMDGTVYFSDPDGHRLLRIDACDATLAPIPCVGGSGIRPVQLDTPRGLWLLPQRRALIVADSGNHRLQLFDPDSLQLLDVWGQADLAGRPQPDAAPGGFNTPWAVTGDAVGNVYVVDYGNQRVQKFNALGEVVPTFWDALQMAGLQQPLDIAAGQVGGAMHLYIVGQGGEAVSKVFVFDTEGHPVRDAAGDPITFGAGHLQEPIGVAASESAVYVGDKQRQRVLVFKRDDRRRDGSFILAGEAVGYRGPIAALALDGQGSLLVHTGTALAPIRLAVDRAYRADGMLWSHQAIKAGEVKVRWHRLQALMEELAPGAHLRFFLYTSNDAQANPPQPDPQSPDPSPWRRFDVDVTDMLIGGDPACCVWIAAHFSGNSQVTPIVSQVRVEFDHQTYLEHLPAIYRNNLQCGDFLTRFLSLFESFYADLEAAIAKLPGLFDPRAAPQEFLPWLAGWLALELDEDWDVETQRRAIAKAFERYAQRGTVEGLRQSLRLLAGVNAVIQEPILNAAWWGLPAMATPACQAEPSRSGSPEISWQETEDSILGFTTMLAPAHAQGAVVGTTATLDQSHLVTSEDFGLPLFEDVAHQFSVQVYRGQVKCAETLPQVRAVIEREKPAHTSYHLCILEPRMRVGFQARVGIDTVVSGPLPAMTSDQALALGQDTVLGGQPSARVGKRTKVGPNTRVG